MMFEKITLKYRILIELIIFLLILYFLIVGLTSSFIGIRRGFLGGLISLGYIGWLLVRDIASYLRKK